MCCTMCQALKNHVRLPLHDKTTFLQKLILIMEDL